MKAIIDRLKGTRVNLLEAGVMLEMHLPREDELLLRHHYIEQWLDTFIRDLIQLRLRIAGPLPATRPRNTGHAG